MPIVDLTFEEFLQHDLHLSADKCDACLRLLAGKLPEALRAYVDPDFTDVRDERYCASFYEEARKKLLGESSCRAMLSADDFALCSQCLKWLAEYLAWRKHKSGIGSTRRKRPPNSARRSDASVIPALTEGEMAEMHIVKRERNQIARARCIAYYRGKYDGRIVCEGCGFDFERAYGELGADFIEVHHLSPISQCDDAYFVSPERDLVPLCANCHAMIHRLLAREGVEGGKALERLRAIIASQRSVNG